MHQAACTTPASPPSFRHALLPCAVYLYCNTEHAAAVGVQEVQATYEFEVRAGCLNSGQQLVVA